MFAHLMIGIFNRKIAEATAGPKKDQTSERKQDLGLDVISLSFLTDRHLCLLKTNGYNTLGDLTEATEEDVMKIKGIGICTIDRIRNGLRLCGYDLKDADKTQELPGGDSLFHVYTHAYKRATRTKAAVEKPTIERTNWSHKLNSLYE